MFVGVSVDQCPEIVSGKIDEISVTAELPLTAEKVIGMIEDHQIFFSRHQF